MDSGRVNRLRRYKKNGRPRRCLLSQSELRGIPNADIFFKNETASKTRTLKHRFVWALLMWAIVEGKVDVSKRNYFAELYAKKDKGYFINQFGNARDAEEFHE
ncbi:hypothetical protein TELCIR_13116, partial [Teladorsagia circumcincta]